MSHEIPNFDIVATNKYLFQSEVACTNYTHFFSGPKLSPCYYFDKSQVIIRERENNKIAQYIEH